MSAAARPPRRAGATRMNRALVRAVMERPWAITEDGLRLVLAVASRRALFPEAAQAAIEARGGRPLENTHAMTIRDGVARCAVVGPLVRYADLFTELSGASSYESLARDVAAALENPAVHAIVLDFDTPGGDVNGCDELAQFLATAQAPDGRPVRLVAYVSNRACSAGMWLAAACDEIVAADTAMLGSLGVMMTYEDTAALDEALGVREITFVSSLTPNKNLDPATDAGAALVQRVVDETAAVFLARVGSYLGVGTDPFQVAQRLGAGGVFVGASAVAVGLADRVGTYEQLHAELVARAAAPLPAPPSARPAARPPTASEGLAMPRAIARSVPAVAPVAADATPVAEAPPAQTPTSPSPAPAFGVDTPVVVAVDRSLAVMAGDRGTVAEFRQGFFYAVALAGGGDVRWLAEDELSVPPAEQPPSEPAPPEGQQAAARADRLTALLRERHPQAVAAIAQQAAAQERARIVAIQSVGAKARVSADAIAAAINDPACTKADAALRFLEAQGAHGAARLAAIQGDETALAQQPGGAPSSVGTADGAAADDDSPDAQAARILAHAQLARGGPRAAGSRPAPTRA